MTELGLILAISIFGLAFAGYLLRWVVAREAGTPEMRRISEPIRTEAEAWLRHRNATIATIAAAVACLLFLGFGFVREHRPFDPAEPITLAGWTSLSFVLGAACSVVAGRAGAWLSVRAPLRTAVGAQTSLDEALRIALRAGAVSGLFVVATSLLGITGLFAIVYGAHGGFSGAAGVSAAIAPKIPIAIAAYGFGASVAALVPQLGGGVGRGPDLFESTAAESVAAMILAATLYLDNAGHLGPDVLGVMLFPLVARAFGIVASIFGVMIVRTEGAEDPVRALERGLLVTAILAVAGFAGAAIWLLDAYWLSFFSCGLVGIATGLAFVYATSYRTGQRHRPVRELAAASVAGPAATLVQGIELGLASAWLPIALLGAAVLGSYELGEASGLAHAGLFGTAVATMGMLSTAGYVLATDTFGPIAQDAAGIVEQSNAKHRADVRATTARLDALAGTTRALAKGYAVGSAALVALLVVSAYVDEIGHYAAGQKRRMALNLLEPAVLVGALAGGALVVWFGALVLRAAGGAANRGPDDASRQPGGPSGEGAAAGAEDALSTERQGARVDAAAHEWLRHTIAPALLALGAPVVLGLGLKALPRHDDPLLAAEAVAALVLGATLVGVVLALFLDNAGSAWSGAKKYIESGAHGGKYLTDGSGVRSNNPTHAAAVVGDTVGAPFTDTAGPSLHVLIKLLSTITLVLAPLFV